MFGPLQNCGRSCDEIHPRQYQMLVEAVELQPQLNEPSTLKPHKLRQLWAQLSDKLNACGVGQVQTADRWRDTLRDWLDATQTKMFEHMDYVEPEPVRPERILRPELTALEERLIGGYGRAMLIRAGVLGDPCKWKWNRRCEQQTEATTAEVTWNEAEQSLASDTQQIMPTAPSSARKRSAPRSLPKSVSLAVAHDNAAAVAVSDDGITPYQRKRLELVAAQTEAINRQSEAIAQLATATVASTECVRTMFAEFIQIQRPDKGIGANSNYKGILK